MKLSRFTVIEPGENAGEYLLYNTARGSFAACSDTMARQLLALRDEQNTQPGCPGDAKGDAKGDAMLGSENDTNSSSQALSHVDELLDNGFIVSRDTDELAPLQEAFARVRGDHSQLMLTIAPTYACNCRCVYCYEQDKAAARGIMSDQVVEALFAFVQERYAATNFNRMFVEWYGGDPQLCLDLVKRIADWLIAFCDERGITYNSTLLSNCTRIGEPEAQLLADIRVDSMLITIDGPRDLHNARRPAADVEDPFGAILNAISAVQARGIRANVIMNADKVNMARIDELRQQLAPLGVDVHPGKLNDYAHTYNCAGGSFGSPDFDLYTHPEFAQASFKELAKAAAAMGSQGASSTANDGHATSAAGVANKGLRRMMKAMLSPCDHFCSGQLEASYIVDCVGDIYKCDGWMGDPSRALFNLLDGSKPVYDNVCWDPFADTDKSREAQAASGRSCKECPLLPLCWGNCSWERECCGWPCHPLDTTMGQYLRLYRSCFDQIPTTDGPQGFQLLTAGNASHKA